MSRDSLCNCALIIFFLLWRCSPTRVMSSSFLRFLDHTQRRTTVGRTSLGEWSARGRDLNLTTHNTHNRQTSKPPVGFEPTISAGERRQTYALERAATGTGHVCVITAILFETHPYCILRYPTKKYFLQPFLYLTLQSICNKGDQQISDIPEEQWLTCLNTSITFSRTAHFMCTVSLKRTITAKKLLYLIQTSRTFSLATKRKYT